MNYKLITSKEGVEYLEKNNKSLKDFSLENTIPSHMGLTYLLANGEVLLLHSNPIGKGEYPGFIFENLQEFQNCRDIDFFPIGKDKMTWLELHANHMSNFLNDSEFYLKPLEIYLKLDVPFKNVTDCESGYNDLVSFIRKKKYSDKEKQELANCYALAIAKFLIDTKGFTLILRKEYEVYNPYYLPVLSSDEKQNVNVIAKLFTALGSGKAVPFRDFYWYLTGIPTHIKID